MYLHSTAASAAVDAPDYEGDVSDPDADIDLDAVVTSRRLRLRVYDAKSL